MINNNFNNTRSASNYDTVIPKQFLNYINYELSFFEKITHKKFFFNIVSNDRFELNVYKSKVENDNNKSKYHLVYSANNLYHFIKNLLMIKGHLIKNFSNKITTT
jgi:hypothetical protein